MQKIEKKHIINDLKINVEFVLRGIYDFVVSYKKPHCN